MSERFTICNVEIDGRTICDVRIADGRIVEVGEKLTSHRDLDGRGGALIPGLVDHHIHLLATAAKAQSIDLASARNASEFADMLRAALAKRPQGAWVRAVGYHERIASDLDRDALDRVAPLHRLRVQHQTGSLWILNSLALETVLSGDIHHCIERDAAGHPTGRIWRGDAWLRAKVGPEPPALAPLGHALAACGVTGIMDASATTDESAAALLASAARAGDLPQHLCLMSAGALAAPRDEAFRIGPLKILLDEHELPDLRDIGARIADARKWGRAVAVHCVTAAELALTLAAFDAFGALPGDRIEHGGIIPAASIPVLARLGLTVVTQPAFIFERGDRYLAEIAPEEHDDIYRCASLLSADIPLAASSDAPYASADPWRAMRAARDRKTRDGAAIGCKERIAPDVALDLFLGNLSEPGGAKRRVQRGAPADLCLLKTPLRDALEALDAELVAATFIGGRTAYQA